MSLARKVETILLGFGLLIVLLMVGTGEFGAAVGWVILVGIAAGFYTLGKLAVISLVGAGMSPDEKRRRAALKQEKRELKAQEAEHLRLFGPLLKASDTRIRAAEKACNAAAKEHERPFGRPQKRLEQIRAPGHLSRYWRGGVTLYEDCIETRDGNSEALFSCP